jgi:hypothetical protein
MQHNTKTVEAVQQIFTVRRRKLEVFWDGGVFVEVEVDK